jgi:hypothetical protein
MQEPVFPDVFDERSELGALNGWENLADWVRLHWYLSSEVSRPQTHRRFYRVGPGTTHERRSGNGEGFQGAIMFVHGWSE